MTNDHHTPECKCLHCDKVLDGAASHDGTPIEPPADGDVTVCGYCGCIMAYDAEGKVRGMTDDEIDATMRDPALIHHLIVTVQRIRMFNAARN